MKLLHQKCSLQSYVKTVSLIPFILPDFQLICAIVWLLHGEGEEYQSLLERFSSITASAETKARALRMLVAKS